MFEFLKKSMYVGLGLATMTKDRIETFAKDVAEYTKMSEEEGRKLAQYLSEESEKARDELEAKISKISEATMARLQCPSRLKALEERMAALETKLADCCPPAEANAEAKGKGAKQES